MDDPFGVRRVQRVSHLNCEVQQFVRLARPGSDAVLQRLPFEKLHDDEELTFVLTNFVNRADVRVVKSGSSAGLALEALQGLMVLC